ncbi:hypothetical protein OAK01_02825 [Candidatus Nitrosopelagicus sp.]|nr:hypothetical protein [Candidatus Nitrosopelagicus sp.]|tara:strand:- start:596 stop:1039 length:444 start_codon:yes stop_codon:yes gene_type:complete
MEHELFFDGRKKNYSWSIRTGSEIVNQIREHPPAYLSGGKLDVKNNIESKFIALHVGIYWGLGVFIIKDYDTVNVMCDSKDMYEILSHNNTTDNQIINDKIHFINQLTNHRNLKINYQIIEQKNNLATNQLYSKGEYSAGKDSREFV